MDTLFPSGFPIATVLYLILYLFTLAIHVVFMNYVLAGSGYLAVASFFGGRAWPRDVVARVLRDWMPFALGATITAGIAPILFVQVLYQTAFYTSHLLLFHRWMSILPVLILTFYLMYLLKTKRVELWSRSLQRVVALIVFLGVAFTGYSWAASHSLALERQQWPSFYVAPPLLYLEPALPPRLATWLFGAMATLSLLVMWQLRFFQRHVPPGGEPLLPEPRHARRMAIVALSGLAAAAGSALLYYALAGEAKQSALTARMVLPYLVAACAGLGLEIGGWVTILRRASWSLAPLVASSVGLGLCIAGVAVVRESVRIHASDMDTIGRAHASAASAGGFWAFAAFLVINAILIWWSLRQARSPRQASRHQPSAPYSD